MGGDLRTTRTYKYLTEHLNADFEDGFFRDFVPSTVSPWLVVLQMMSLDDTLEILVQGGVVLGRGAPTVKHLDLSQYGGHRFGVSRQHAALHVQDNRLVVRDLDSSNGTYLNGYRLAAGVDTPLKEGDILEVGKLRIRLVLASRAASV